ncbi:hypothetical protein L596_023215 [Steinernema carpocapsae]|uniref:SXP/RAL-2 family protein Ani s 5-like cation-binding domain-containing protein n=1 Tax=Steinernema carpocapsae TaxID=34508 RepID=A0A4U5MD02_STECR|nr:hypothetical protein L596_023215 [Steinernema carpocapsae]
MKLTVLFVFSAALCLIDASAFGRINFRRYGEVLNNLVPKEIIDFYHGLNSDELRTFREAKRELFRAHLNGSELSDQEINEFIKNKSSFLLEKKEQLEKTINEKIGNLPGGAQAFVRSLNVTNVFRPKFESDARRSIMAALKTGYKTLSEEDRTVIVKEFPNFQRVFAWLMRFSGPEVTAPVVAIPGIPVIPEIVPEGSIPSTQGKPVNVVPQIGSGTLL